MNDHVEQEGRAGRLLYGQAGLILFGSLGLGPIDTFVSSLTRCQISPMLSFYCLASFVRDEMHSSRVANLNVYCL